MAAKGIEQATSPYSISIIVVLMCIDYGLALTTMSHTTLMKLDRVQKEAKTVILGVITTMDTLTETTLAVQARFPTNASQTGKKWIRSTQTSVL